MVKFDVVPDRMPCSLALGSVSVGDRDEAFDGIASRRLPSSSNSESLSTRLAKRSRSSTSWSKINKNYKPQLHQLILTIIPNYCTISQSDRTKNQSFAILSIHECIQSLKPSKITFHIDENKNKYPIKIKTFLQTALHYSTWSFFPRKS